MSAARLGGALLMALVVTIALGGCGDAATAPGVPVGKTERGLSEVVFSVAFSDDGHTLASARSRDIRLWDVRTRRSLGAPVSGYRGIDNAVFGRRGHTLAYAGGKAIQLLDARTRRQAVLLAAQHEFEKLAFSDDGFTLAYTFSDSNRIRLWDVRARKPIGAPLLAKDAPYRSVDALALSPDGGLLAAGYDNEKLWLWDVRTRRQIGKPLRTGTYMGVRRLSFAADGRTLLAVGIDGPSRLWNVRTHKQLGAAVTGSVEDATLSLDGRLLAYTDGNAIRLRDVRSRRHIGSPLTGHTDSVVGLAFSRDARTLASGGADSTVRLWDVRTGTSLGATR